MPKISLSLQDAKAKDSEILEKLGRVQKAAQGQRQQTKLGQQRREWTEQARRLSSEARQLELELEEAATSLGLLGEVASGLRAFEESSSELWFQVSGARRLVAKAGQRDAGRLQKAPAQACELRDLLGGVSEALAGVGAQLAAEASGLEKECLAARRSLRQAPGAEALLPPAERNEDRCEDLSGEEDALLDQIAEAASRPASGTSVASVASSARTDGYESELQRLSDQVLSELARLDQELAELRRRRSGWDDEAHFRFVCIRRQFQGRDRELLLDRLALEFPHLSRERIVEHEALVDALRFASQKRSAAFRQWRRERLALLRRHQSVLEDQRRALEDLSARRREGVELRGKQKKLQARLEAERRRVSLRREEEQRLAEEEERRRRAAEAMQEEAQKRHMQEVKSLAEDNQRRRREAQEREQEEAAERARVEAEERARRLELNSERVRLRRQRDEIKQRELADQRNSLEQERLEREQRLQRLMEQLKVEAPRDPERLFKMPARSQAEAYADPLQCVVPGGRGPHVPLDERRLMADARYKMSAALQAAGLYGTKAGQEALARVAPPRPTAQHFVSHVFDGYPS